MEAAGLAVGIVGLAALFNNVVEIIDYVDIGSNFERDYETYQLRLEDTSVRLYRWAEAAGVHDDATARQQLGSHYDSAYRRLHQIKLCFEESREISGRYNHGLENPQLQTAEQAMSSRSNRVRTVFRKLYAPQRRFQTKAAWALHGREAFNRLIFDTDGLVQGLESLVPQQRLRSLADLEVKEIDNPEDVRALVEATTIGKNGNTEPQDNAFNIAAVNRFGHSYVRVQNQGEARVNMGDFVTVDAVASGVTETGRKHEYTDVTNSGKAKVFMGNTIGMKSSFWDD